MLEHLALAAARRLHESAAVRRKAAVEGMKQARLDFANAEGALEKAVLKLRPWSRMYKHPYLSSAGIRIRMNRYTDEVRYEHAVLGKLTQRETLSMKRSGYEPNLVFEDLDLLVVRGPYALGHSGARVCFLQKVQQRSNEDADAAAVLVQGAMSIMCMARTNDLNHGLDAATVPFDGSLRRAWESNRAPPSHTQSIHDLMQQILMLSVELLVLVGEPENVDNCVTSFSADVSCEEEASESEEDDCVASEIDTQVLQDVWSAGSLCTSCRNPECTACNAGYAAERQELRSLCPIWHRLLQSSISWQQLSNADNSNQLYANIEAALNEQVETLKQAASCSICQGVEKILIKSSTTKKCCLSGIGRRMRKQALNRPAMGKGGKSKGISTRIRHNEQALMQCTARPMGCVVLFCNGRCHRPQGQLGHCNFNFRVRFLEN